MRAVEQIARDVIRANEGRATFDEIATAVELEGRTLSRVGIAAIVATAVQVGRLRIVAGGYGLPEGYCIVCEYPGGRHDPECAIGREQAADDELQHRIDARRGK